MTYDELLVDDEIAHALQSVKARRLLVLFASCHSGDATRADLSRGQPKSVEFAQASKYIELPSEFRVPDLDAARLGSGDDGELGLAGDGRLFIAASNEEELSWVAPDLGLSLFTYFFTDRIAGAQDKSFEELVGEVSPRVNQYAQQYFQVPQSPHIEGSAEAASTALPASPAGTGQNGESQSTCSSLQSAVDTGLLSRSARPDTASRVGEDARTPGSARTATGGVEGSDRFRPPTVIAAIAEV